MTGIEHDPVLFGADPTVGIVAVEFVAPDRVQVYRREGERTVVEEVMHRPFAWATEPVPGELRELAGAGAFKFAVSFDHVAAFAKAKTTYKRELFALNDLAHQYLLASGRTLFKGMAFEDLQRMQVDIETFTGADGAMSDASKDPLLAIALSDSSGWEEILLVDDPEDEAQERALLEKFVALVRARDPDVLEGHNIFRFDLPYLEARARKLKVKLDLGRDGSALRSHPSRLQIAERLIQYRKFEIHGRQIIDTLFLVQFHDVGARELQSFGLKAAARHFGVAEDSRVELGARAITEAHGQERKKFVQYARQDVRETRGLSAALSPAWFTQTTIFPYNYQDVVIRGNATKINSLFLREYLRQGQSVPGLPDVQRFEGGYTDIFFTGVARGVWHCDIASLYPSVMLAFGIFPESDTLGVFGDMLGRLRKFRLEAKSAMRSATGLQRAHLDALQGTFKILINSFYGYLGFAQGNFADFEAAAAVTAKGRELLRGMVDWLRQRGADVIEIDTDGIYFTPPKDTTWDGLYEELAATLPKGIEVEFDARYAAMFSYKAKNYALLSEDGKLSIKGAALKSRGLEKFQRIFIERAVRALCEGKPEMIPSMHAEFAKALRDRMWEPEMFAKTEALQDSLEAYQKKIAASSRNRSAAFELALRSGRKMQAGDRVTYYITGNKKTVKAYESAKLVGEWDPKNRDENTAYYLAKLDELAGKFEAFVPASAGGDRLL
ncbi:MAG: DNA polymerase II [Verrucomicrobia bacterium]|nr:DNA polymerase II [Verrucomicrobiota bacterium]MDA1203181.1 DNA polymerase II [Verrucomicrobiota bacterium]